MVDEMAVIGMIFSLLCLLLVGGFILAFPAARRLGDVLDAWVESRREDLSSPRVEELRSEVGSLRTQLAVTRDRVDSLAERQDFAERLLEERTPTDRSSVETD